MSSYREIAPPPRLQETVECFWTMRRGASDPSHRVMPDGCADILFSHGPSLSRLEVVGPMIEYRDYPAADELLTGLRFRPGMSGSHLRIPSGRLTGRLLPLEDLWGSSAARRLLDRLPDAPSPEACAAILAEALRPVELTPLQRAIAWMERRRGCVSMDELATRAGVSARQLRRICQEQTGLTPKFLARILRFRHALGRVPLSSFADLALECGYYDQAHLIHDFRTFSGVTPAVYFDGRFFQSATASISVA